MDQMSLWGDEFAIKEDDVKLVLKKSRSGSEKKPKKSESQMIKSKIIPIEDKLRIIEENVHRILGDFEKDTVVIRDYEEFSKYLDIAIENAIIKIDYILRNILNRKELYIVMDRSDLANRMKNYEKVSKTVLINRIPVAIRL